MAFLIVLGILIFFHELGHFLVAKANKVGVLKFSLGFGPAILKRRIGETEYRLSAIPLGGYVKMLGENESEEEITHIDPKRSFAKKRLISKASIVAAGPIANFVLAFAIYCIIAWIGLPAILPIIGEIQKGSPAYNAGLLKGDKIMSIDGTQIDSWQSISPIIQGAGEDKTIDITIERGSRTFIIHVRPKITKMKNIFGEEVDKAVIGISPSGDIKMERLGPIGGIQYGLTQTYKVIEITCIALWKILNGTINIKESIGGPIMIAQVSGQTFKAGLLPFFSMIAFISINLALINLLPIPILDGGHLLLFLIEGITGKPIEGKPREIAQQIGLFVLILLMVFAFYNDIIRIISNR
ncbi:MAG: RIP metalloprotease RseP [Deltaproteobacteria bacterium]|nr:RIP metalloprotease RseP [Deltaproteobacteria bacterium]